MDFGLAIKNFVGPTETPDIDAEAFGFESLWAWEQQVEIIAREILWTRRTAAAG